MFKKHKNKTASPKRSGISPLAVTAITAVAFSVGFIAHVAISVKRSEYDGLVLYCDSLDKKVNSLQKRIEDIENTKISTDTAASDTPTKENTATKSGESGEHMVWITKSGQKYHEDGCQSITQGAQQIPLEQAEASGKEPCKRCH